MTIIIQQYRFFYQSKKYFHVFSLAVFVEVITKHVKLIVKCERLFENECKTEQLFLIEKEETHFYDKKQIAC